MCQRSFLCFQGLCTSSGDGVVQGAMTSEGRSSTEPEWGSDVKGGGSLGREAGMSNRPPSFCLSPITFSFYFQENIYNKLRIVELLLPYVFCRHFIPLALTFLFLQALLARTTRTSGQYTMELVQHRGQQALTIKARKSPFLDFEKHSNCQELLRFALQHKAAMHSTKMNESDFCVQ